jgi:hypothetical protein
MFPLLGINHRNLIICDCLHFDASISADTHARVDQQDKTRQGLAWISEKGAGMQPISGSLPRLRV